MPTVGTLAYNLVANTGGLTSGLVGTRSEMKALKDAFLQSMKPVDMYSQAIAELERLAAKFPERADQISGSIAQMNAELNKLNVDPKQTWLGNVKANSIKLEYDQRLQAVRQYNRDFIAAQREQGPMDAQVLPSAQDRILSGFQRMGIVIDPVNAAFQAMHVVTGLVRTGLDALGAAAEMVGDRMEVLDDIAKRARLLGVAETSLVGLAAAAEDLAGVGGQQFDVAFTKLAQSIAEAAAEGKGPAHDAFKRLGLDAKELSGLKADEALLRIADAMQNVENHGERLDLAKAIGGRGGAELATMLAAGREEIERIADRAVELSQTEFINFDNIESANDSVGRLKMLWEGIVGVLASELAPLIEGITGDMTGGFEGANSKAGELRETLQVIALTIAYLVDQAEGLGKTLSNPALMRFLDFASSTLPYLSDARDMVEGTGRLAGAVGGDPSADPGSRFSALQQAQLDALNKKPSTDGPTVGEVGESAKAKEDAEKASDAAAKKEQAAYEKRMRERDEIERLRGDFQKAEQKEIQERIAAADKMRERIIETTRSIGEKMGLELGDILSSGLTSNTQREALEELRFKALQGMPTAVQTGTTTGAVRAGSIEALRAQFNAPIKDDKALAEAKRQTTLQGEMAALLARIETALASIPPSQVLP
jgi:hypothetical protein